MTITIDRRTRAGQPPRREVTRPSIRSYSPDAEPCGVADYHDRLAAALGRSADCSEVRLPVDRVGRHRPSALIRRLAEVRRLAAVADGSDLAILPYTDSIWNGPRPGESTLPAFLGRLRVPIVMVLHEFPARPDPESHKGSRLVRLAKSLACSALAWSSGGRVDRAFGRMHRIVVHSVELADRLGALGVPADRVLLRPFPAFETAAGSTEPAGLDPRFGLEGRRLLLIFGFPDPRKGFEIAIEALGRLPEDVALGWVGGSRGGSDREAAGRLMELARSVGVADRFVPLGYREGPELAAILGRASLGLAPFREATGSSTISHFVAAGLPVVASDLRPIRPIAEGGAGVELVPSGDASALAGAVAALLGDAPRRQSMASRSRAFASRHTFGGLASELTGLATFSDRGRVR